MNENINYIYNSEVKKFDNISNNWWDAQGNMKMLHYINPLRLAFILNQIYNNFIQKNEQISILDFGCGVGILVENLKRLKFGVLGIDGSEKLIKIAREHAKKKELDVDFLHQNVDELPNLHKKFDLIIASEVLEHLRKEQIEKFFSFCQTNLYENGLVIISTINQTLPSLIFAKFVAEYILKWVPKKTHDWKNFLKPSFINNIAKKKQFKLIDLKGMNFNPFDAEKWQISNNITMNYLACWQKQS